MKKYIAETSKIIAYFHGSDMTIESININLDHFHLLIMQYENCGFNKDMLRTKYLSDSNIRKFENSDLLHRCEVACTGPYHIADYTYKDSDNKEELRKQVADKINKKIPNNKPVVFLPEDEISHVGQIILSMNRMAEFCTVIFKAAYSISDQYKHYTSKLKKNVIFVSDSKSVPNLLRFSADFVMAGYCSATFISSILLGLPCIPYYSRIVKHKKQNQGDILRPYTTGISDINSISFINNGVASLRHAFHKSGHLFDLLDTKKLKDAILGTEYLAWYQKNLPEFQKLFGRYMLDGSPEKTAEYILRFVHEGTLGKDCAAVLLHDKDFHFS